MGTPINLNGQQFGKLRVIEKGISVKRNKKTLATWRCVCDCGLHITCRAGDLLSGGSTSCGCSRTTDLSGQLFYRLTVLRPAGEKRRNGRTLWVCQCTCGTETNVGADSLRSGATKSCGCWRRDTASSMRTLPEGVAGLRHILRTYKRNAFKRGIPWRLSDEEVQEIVSKNCHYCGIEPRPIKGVNASAVSGVFNGIDRKSSLENYTLDNVVSCCSTCNLAKGDKSYTSFIQYLQRVGEFRLRQSLVETI
jgi:5-methylcytosine-specific restriction endonuclease McrA